MSERAAQQSSAGTSSARWVKPALLVSVAINLLIVGVIAGFIIRHYKNSSHSYGAYRGKSVLGFARTLPAQRRQALRPLFDNAGRTLQPLRRQVTQARRAVRQAVLAQPFDIKAYETAVAKRLDALIGLRKTQNSLFAQLNANFTASERKAYVDWHRQRQMNRKHGRPYER